MYSSSRWETQEVIREMRIVRVRGKRGWRVFRVIAVEEVRFG
jgi:hypothetical protein